jgi:hypothetical protein
MLYSTQILCVAMVLPVSCMVLKPVCTWLCIFDEVLQAQLLAVLPLLLAAHQLPGKRYNSCHHCC